VVVIALALVACGGESTPPETEPTVEHVHAYNEEIVAPTCATPGSLKMVCACGDVQSEEILGVSDHTPSVADCEKDTVCTVCNAVLVEATGHNFGAVETVAEATCANAGKEKATCLSCGKVVETEIPSTGHIAGTEIKKEGDGFAVNCKSCGQAVVVKAAETIFALPFEEDIATEAAKYSNSGLTVFKPEACIVQNGVLTVTASENIVYLDITDPTALANNGMLMISFDFMSTKEGNDADMASVFSLLGHFYGGKPNYNGTTGWGWIFKLIEDKNIISTTNTRSKMDDSNSIAIERNVNYKVECVIIPTTKIGHIFINGNYIGSSNMLPKISELNPAENCFRFGDGPLCGYVYDNFKIESLK
jgi:hypothetical protein